MAHPQVISSDLDNHQISSSITCEVSDAFQYLNGSLNNNLTIITQNIRSIGRNMPHFEAFLANVGIDFDILVLTECWLTKNSCPPSLQNYNYYLTKNCTNQNEGVVTYISTALAYEVYEPPILDANCIVIKLGNLTAIISIYRSPSVQNIDNFLTSLDDILKTLSSYKNIIVTGDINLNIHNDIIDPRSNTYLNMLASHGLQTGHTLPTRGKNCLDHMNLKTACRSNVVIIKSSVTDHFPVCLVMESRTNHKILNKPHDKIDFSKSVEYIRTNLSTDLFKFDDANKAVESLAP